MADLGGGISVARVETDDFQPDEDLGGTTDRLFETGVVAVTTTEVLETICEDAELRGGAAP